MSGYIWLAFWLGYLVAGAVYARSLIGVWTRDPKSTVRVDDDGGDRAMTAMGALALGLVWPLTMGFRRLRDWLWRPIDRNAERVKRLEADRDEWYVREHNSTTDEERRMARDIRTTLDDVLRSEKARR